jgi:uncharacterized protein (DUF1778 family)
MATGSSIVTKSSRPVSAVRRTKERKTARMELRLTASSKAMIERAVAVSGLAPGDLAYEAARRIVEDGERFVLRDADRDAFFRAVLNPPAPTKKLIAALARHRERADRSR